MKAALIGYGYWGKVIRKYIDESECFSLKYIFDKNYVCDILYVNSLDVISIDEEINVVFIATPVQTHYEYSLKMLSCGKHVFCEKPAVLQLKDFLHLRTIAEENNVVFFTDYTYIYSEGIYKIKSLLHKIGKIKLFTSHIGQYGNFYDNQSGYQIIGVHMLAIIFYLLENEIMSVYIDEIPNNYINHIKVILSENIICLLNIDMLSTEKIRKFTIIGEFGQIEYNMLKSPNIILTKYIQHDNNFNVAEQEFFSTNEKNSLTNTLKTFEDCIMLLMTNYNIIISQQVQEALDMLGK